MYRVKLDDYTALDKIEDITERYCQSIDDELDAVARILVDHRKERSDSEWWPLVSTGSQYRCTVTNCRRTQELLKKKKDLKKHIRSHSVEERDNQSVDYYVEQGTVDL